MKKKLLSILLLIVSFGITAQDFTAKSLENEAVLSVNWFQTSGEYNAISYQAFNLAKESFQNIKKNYKGDKKLAVVVDLDETMVDNSPYAAWRIKAGKSFEGDTWDEWVKAREAEAVPGAIDFAKHINSNGGYMIYVSNRSNKMLRETMQNLKALGFPGVNKNNIYLKNFTSDKTERRKKIKKEGYEIVMLVGDQLTDFSNEVYHRFNDYRNEFAEDNKYKFGYNWIVIPNPTYGDFEGKGVDLEYYAKITGQPTSEKEKSEMRQSRLKIWDGE